MDFTQLMNNVQRAAATSPTTPASPAASKKSVLDTTLGILNTPGGAALVGAAGAGISAYGANKAAQAGREQNAQQFAADMANRQLNADREFGQNAAIGAANASPLGAEQSYAQRNALLGAILGNTRNYSATPGDSAVAAAMGSTNQGGMRLPEGGFDPAMLDRMFGDKATMESIANRQMRVGQIDPRGQALNLGTMYGDAGVTASQGVADAGALELQRQFAEQQKQREIIQRAIDEDIRGEKQPEQKKKGNIFGKILKGVGVGASFIPGVGQIVAPIATAAGGLINGDGWKSALGNAALSAVPMGLGKVAKGAGTAAKIAQTVKKVPAPILSAVLSGGR